MMRFEAITAKIPRFDLIARAIELALTEEAEIVKRQLGQFFMTWEGKPDVAVRVERTADYIVAMAYLIGDDGILDIVKWVVFGTDPHPIPKQPKDYPLRFPSTYTPKTAPGVIQSTPGGKHWDGDWTVKFQVSHPGNAPRDTFRVIADDRRSFFRAKMTRSFVRGLANAVRRGVKR